MDVEQAMAWAEWAKSAGSEEHMQKAARAAVTLAAEVRRLQGAERQLKEASEIDTYETCEGPPAPARRWSSSGTWLYPGDRVVVLYAAEAAREGRGT